MSTEDLQAENIAKFMQDGPRLRADYNVWIVKKDSPHNKVLLGGLGGMGVGQMWTDMLERYKSYPGFDEAPELKAEGEGDDVMTPSGDEVLEEEEESFSEGDFFEEFTKWLTGVIEPDGGEE
jgi:hypothetical protein